MFSSLGGALVGFLLGGYISLAVLQASGQGQSHVDAFPLAAFSVAGAFICAIAFPIILFIILSRRQR